MKLAERSSLRPDKPLVNWKIEECSSHSINTRLAQRAVSKVVPNLSEAVLFSYSGFPWIQPRGNERQRVPQPPLQHQLAPLQITPGTK